MFFNFIVLELDCIILILFIYNIISLYKIFNSIKFFVMDYFYIVTSVLRVCYGWFLRYYQGLRILLSYKCSRLNIR